MAAREAQDGPLATEMCDVNFGYIGETLDSIRAIPRKDLRNSEEIRRDYTPNTYRKLVKI